MIANIRNDSGNILRQVTSVEFYPNGKITSGYISIHEENGIIKIYITDSYKDKVDISILKQVKGE